MKKILFTLTLLISAVSFGQKLSELEKRADILYNSDDFYGSISVLNEIIEIDSQYAIDNRIYYQRGTAKQILQDYEGALSDFNIEVPPMFADLQWRKGLCYYNLGNYQKAIDYQNKALELYNEYVDAYYYRGLSKWKLNDYYGAISDFTKVIELEDDTYNVGAYRMRGVSKEKIGDLNGACADWKKASRLGDADAAEWVANQCN